MKKIFFSVLIIFTLTGCWNYKELNDYSIVTGIAIDKGEKENEIDVSLLIANSQKNSGDTSTNKSQTVVYSGTGKSLFEAIKDIGLISPKELYFGHFSAVVISEEIAKNGIFNILDSFLREATSTKNFYVAIAKDCSAKDTLKIISPLTNFPSQNISENLSSSTKLQGSVSKTTFNELLSSLIRTGIEPTINSIEIIGDIKKGSSEKNAETSEPEAFIKLGNLGIFKEDKFVKWANYNESVGINIINNKITEMYLNIDLDDGYLVLDSTSFSTKTNVEVKNDIPKVNIFVKGEAKIVEVRGDIKLSDDKILKSIQKKANKLIKKRINEAINIAIENKTDIFGFGLKFFQECPDYYKKSKKDWNNNLEKIEININSNLILKSTGSAEKTLEEENDEK